MTRDNYIKKLQNYLRKLPQSEIEEITYEINMHFEEAIKAGRNEMIVADALGHPKRLASAILLEYDVSQLSSDNTALDKFLLIMRIIGIGFKNIIVAPFLLTIGLIVFSIYLIVFSFYLMGGTFVIAPIIKYIAPAIVSTGPIPLMLYPVIGLIVLLVTKKLHQLLSKYSSGIINYLIKYVKVDYKKLTL